MAGEAPAIEDSATALAGSRTELDGAWRQFGSARSPEEFCRHWLAVLLVVVVVLVPAVRHLVHHGLRECPEPRKRPENPAEDERQQA